MQRLIFSVTLICMASGFYIQSDQRPIRESWPNRFSERRKAIATRHESRELAEETESANNSNMTVVFQSIFDELAEANNKSYSETGSSVSANVSQNINLTLSHADDGKSPEVAVLNNSQLSELKSSAFLQHENVRRDAELKSETDNITSHLRSDNKSEQLDDNQNYVTSLNAKQESLIPPFITDFINIFSSDNWITAFRKYTADLAILLRKAMPGVRWQNLDNFLKFDPSEYVTIEEFFNTFPGLETIFQWDPNGFFAALKDPSVQLVPIVINETPLKGDLKSVYYRKSNYIKLIYDFLHLMADKLGFELPDVSGLFKWIGNINLLDFLH